MLKQCEEDDKAAQFSSAMNAKGNLSQLNHRLWS
jgi:hypothetical protein